MAERRLNGLTGLAQAFDEVRFGRECTLNLRERLPTAAEAVRQLDAWLRERQMAKAGEVLVISGRGNNSADGISVVREATIRTLHELRRKAVVAEFSEHTAGSFVVELAKVSALLEIAKRRREQAAPPPSASPPTLAELQPATRNALRVLAERSLDALGLRDRDRFLEGEMLRLFGALAASMPQDPDAGIEKRLLGAIEKAMDDYD